MDTIKEMRVKLGMTQQGFADYLGIPYRSIQNWEGGQRQCPDYVVELVKARIDAMDINERFKAVVKIYDELGFENPDVLNDYKNGYLSINKARNGREVLWYLDSYNEVAIYTDNLERLDADEIEKELE